MLRSIASTGASTPEPRCDASRSMRARASSPVLILRDARTRVRVCGNTSVCALLRMRTSIAFQPSSRCQTAHLVPAAHFCVRGLHPCFTHPRIEGWAERRETFGCSGTRWAYHDAGRSPLGAPPWRFWASGPRFRLLRRPPSYNGGQLPSASCSELLAARS